MKYYGTKNNKDFGFYTENFENAIEITDEYWKKLLNEQNNGKIIINYQNSVIAVSENDYSKENNTCKKLTQKEKEIKQLTIKNAIRMQEIQDQLETLDKKRVRAIAEPSLKDENTTWLEYYNKQIQELRKELSSL